MIETINKIFKSDDKFIDRERKIVDLYIQERERYVDTTDIKELEELAFISTAIEAGEVSERINNENYNSIMIAPIKTVLEFRDDLVERSDILADLLIRGYDIYESHKLIINQFYGAGIQDALNGLRAKDQRGDNVLLSRELREEINSMLTELITLRSRNKSKLKTYNEELREM